MTIQGLIQSFGFHNRLVWRIVKNFVFFAIVLSILTTSYQLKAGFALQREQQFAALDRIEAGIDQALKLALLNQNETQINALLGGLIAEPQVAYVVLTDRDNRQWMVGTRDVQPEFTQRSYTLFHPQQSLANESIGNLEVGWQHAPASYWLQDNFWDYFVPNMASVFLATITLLLLVYHMVTRHLRDIAAYIVHRSGKDGPPLKLNRTPPKHKDALDYIVTALTDYENRTRDQLTKLEEQISQRKRSEKAAKDALSVRSNFLATMSHEIRTPLNAIIGFLHLIETHAQIQEKPKLYASMATKSAHQLLAQLNNTLDMSRLEAHAMETKPEKTDVNSLTRTWVEMGRASAYSRKHDVDIKLNLSPDLDQHYNLDPLHVTQIITNLVDNAVKFTHSGEIKLSVRPNSLNGLDILVCDTGIGIPQDARERVFDRFNQAESGLCRTFDGTGLGLSISKELALLMGAELTLLDEHNSKFATSFQLRLKNTVLEEQHLEVL